MLNRCEIFKIWRFCHILHFFLKKYHNPKSCQNMLIVLTSSFLYHKLQLWFICHLLTPCLHVVKEFWILKFCSLWGKNTIRGATQVNGHSLKLHFYMFERSQGKCIIIWIVIKKIGIFFVNCKVYMLKVWHTSKKKLHVQNIQTCRMDSPYFSQTFLFPYKMCTILSENWRGF